MITDPISDMLTRIRNAQAVKKATLALPYSNIKFAIAKILVKEGFVEKAVMTTESKFPMIQIDLKYSNNLPAIQSIQRVSKPGRRVYTKSEDLRSILSGLGITIVSTSNGLMTNKEAHARHLGGEVLCEVY
ncbi:MAG: 30S ribosomal protein S8 [Candidatus Uhrbacteria bacterium]|nr:30S ribosomal protein S8 [Candidatus Uhrbacteria bacterium]